MDHPWPRGAAHCHRVAREIGFGDRGKHSVFLMTDENELDSAVAPQRVHHRVQRISHDSITTLHAGLRQHLPQYVRHFFRHEILPIFFVIFASSRFDYRSRFSLAISRISSPRPLRMALNMKRLKPFACSKVIVGGMASSCRATETSTSAGPLCFSASAIAGST